MLVLNLHKPCWDLGNSTNVIDFDWFHRFSMTFHLMRLTTKFRYSTNVIDFSWFPPFSMKFAPGQGRLEIRYRTKVEKVFSGSQNGSMKQPESGCEIRNDIIKESNQNVMFISDTMSTCNSWVFQKRQKTYEPLSAFSSFLSLLTGSFHRFLSISRKNYEIWASAI